MVAALIYSVMAAAVCLNVCDLPLYALPTSQVLGTSTRNISAEPQKELWPQSAALRLVRDTSRRRDAPRCFEPGVEGPCWMS